MKRRILYYCRKKKKKREVKNKQRNSTTYQNDDLESCLVCHGFTAELSYSYQPSGADLTESQAR